MKHFHISLSLYLYLFGWRVTLILPGRWYKPCRRRFWISDNRNEWPFPRNPRLGHTDKLWIGPIRAERTQYSALGLKRLEEALIDNASDSI